MGLVATAVAALALAQSVVAGLAPDEAVRLEACLDRIEIDAEAAYEDGLAWLGQGSRPPARYCVARALIELGETAAGAAQLEDLANAPDAGGLDKRATYLAQSGNAWLAAGYAEAATTTLTNALKLRAGDASLLTDRAAAYLALSKLEPAVADLDDALAVDPGLLDAYELRARARLALEQFDAALSDIERARELAPDNVDLLVLRGDIREARRIAAE